MNPMHIKIKPKGSVLIEFALLLPVFIVLILGTIEAGWALFIQNTLSDAAREGARIAVTQNVSFNSIVSSVDTILANAKISPGAVSVNITPPVVNQQTKGAPITVTVSMPYSASSILPTPMFLGSVSLEAEVTMSKEY